jgi:putative acyl-CoA dehydrogenase
MATHEVFNQSVPLEGHDVAGLDVALMDGLTREGAAWACDELREVGCRAGDPAVIHNAELANANPPVLHTHDRFGHRIDTVEYHPAYHALMTDAVRFGLHAAPWADGRPGAHVARAAKFSVWSQVEQGHGCPISMTYSVIPALRSNAAVAADWEPLLSARDYDKTDAVATTKRGALAGMAMTEKQGGSDVRANTTRAVPTGGEYALTGHKWFCSAPMCDLFLMLAYTDVGLSCFAVPRWRPDGSHNAIAIQRLKDKLGNRSNASSEIELHDATGWLVGNEGRGIATIIQMVNHTRLDCVVGVVAQMRAALSQAVHHCTRRAAFGKLLIEQPLMQNVLSDLAVESEAATVTMLRLARAYDTAESSFARLATAVAKYWVCKRASVFVAECLECLGGAGYVEESPMPRLFRESPLNGIWEGSGNVICLDALRAVQREPESLTAFLAEVEQAAGADARLDRAIADVHAELSDTSDLERRARRPVERLALVLQASLLVRHAPTPVADAFCATRLAGDGGRAFGTLPPSTPMREIIERAWPPAA